jgi:hypothetical protein
MSFAADPIVVEGPPAPPDAGIDVQYRMTIGDVFRASAEGSRYSRMMVLFGALGAFGCLFGILTGDLLSLLWLLVVIGLVSGILPGALVAGFARQRRDLLAREIHLQADEAGIRMQSPGASSEVDWATFRRMRDMSAAVLLDFGTGAATFVPKRALTPPEQLRLLELGRRRGLLEGGWSWKMPLAGVLPGLAAGLVLVALTINNAPA